MAADPGRRGPRHRRRPDRRPARPSYRHPAAGVRRSGSIRLWNRGSAAAIPGVSAQPGCMALNTTSLARDAPRPLAYERDLGALGVRVGARAFERRVLPLEVVESESLRIHPARGHGDHACASGRTEQGQQSGEQGERPEDHGREGRLESVRALDSLGEDRAGVVDDDVEPGFRGQDVRHRVPDRRQRGHVGDDGRKAVGAMGPDQVIPNHGEPVTVTTHQDDAGPQTGQRVSRCPAETRSRSGDQDRLAAQHVGGWWCPPMEAAAH